LIRWKIAQAAELKWWQNYLKNKDTKSYLEWKKSYWIKFLQKCAICPPQNTDCLDAGCGPAGIFIILENNTVDACDPLIDKYEGLDVFDKTSYANVNFFKSSIENFKFEKQYDNIFCLNAINHVADLKNSISKLSELLKESGTLLLSTDVHRHEFLKAIFRLLPGDILHPQQHSLKDYRKMIAEKNLEITAEILIKRTTIFDYYAFVIKKSNA
jgi:2-polyprenyl-6-hydroxyphenyl methylase/3-demethylubiquinone-9 3-methyltransferase